MKKFFGKLPVMITFIVLAVIMTVAYIGLLVRPVAIGFTYKGEEDFFGTDKKRATGIFNSVVENMVTPCTLEDIAEDMAK